MSKPMTAAQLDAEYNNRARVPEFQRHLDDWVSSSQRARTQPCVLDLPYGEQAGERLDIFPAAAGRKLAPVMVFIHGGYWRSLDKSDHSFVAPPYTTSGVCVVVLNYDLCPSVTIPNITMQMVRALAWIHDHIADHGGDPGNLCVVGHSAGGHLAAMMLACDWRAYRPDLPDRLVSKAMSISGLFDLSPIRRTPFLQASLRLTPRDVRRASPFLLRTPAGARMACVVGGNESQEFRRQNQLLRAAWGSEVVDHCLELPGEDHFSILRCMVMKDHRLHNLINLLLCNT